MEDMLQPGPRRPKRLYTLQRVMTALKIQTTYSDSLLFLHVFKDVHMTPLLKC